MSIENPSTFLDLVQRTRLECGISGNGPSTVIDRTGLEQRLVGWVAESWRHIQSLHQDWHFLRRETTFLTQSGKYEYSPSECGITNGKIGKWIIESIRNFPTATGRSGEIFMTKQEYDTLRDTWLYSANLDQRTRPYVFAINPVDHGLVLGPIPNADYTILGQYYEAPTVLATDTDVPNIPTPYIMAIVYKAMQKYGTYDSAPEVRGRGREEYRETMAPLQREYMNQLHAGAPLA